MNLETYPYKFQEHEAFTLHDSNSELHEKFKYILRASEVTEDLSRLQLLGMTYDWHKDSFTLSYYVGAVWIDRSQDKAMMVLPKIKDIDFHTMFMDCFSCKDVNNDLDKIFYIRTEDKPIKISSDDFQLEPLLIIYFMNLVAKIVRQGLRNDYVVHEEELNGKIKGKILMSQYIKKGIANNRKDHVYCRFQEYGIDCIDNRILKVALLFCRDMIQRNSSALGKYKTDLINLLNESLPAFENVSVDVSIQDLQRVHVNPLYKNYKAAIPIAKMIIKKQGYCVTHGESEKEQMFPPFIINMPLLFEMYVYSLLKEKYHEKIQYQISTTDSAIDFGKLDEHIILDTKYKPQWQTENVSENIRQLSGYARNRSIRKKLYVPDDNFICPCIIIYPNKDGVENFTGWNDEMYNDTHTQMTDIDTYLKFKKIAVKLPQIPSNSI